MNQQQTMQEDYTSEQSRTCCVCGITHPLGRVLAFDGVRVQAWSRKLFCYPACWQKYREKRDADMEKV